MTKLFTIFLSYILIFFNTSLLGEDNSKQLKIGLLAPFSGEYKSLGNSLMFSVQLALKEIGNEKIKIIPRDSGSENKKKMDIAIKEIINEGAKIIIGPVDSVNSKQLSNYKDTIFISLSNKEPEISDNVINIGISLESQLLALQDFIIKKNKTKTVVMYPENEYSNFIEEKIKKIKLKRFKTFKYNSDPKFLTGEIEKLTNYSQRKRSLEIRKKILEKKDDEKSKNELELLEQKYTLGKVNFDSVIIIDFGDSLKSTLTSLLYSDVNEKDVLFTTVNQWFDESIFYENSIKKLFYPSVDLKNFKKYNNEYLKTFKNEPSEISILAYDAVGLIYYIWKKNDSIKSIDNFFIKDKIKGKIGTFSFKDNKVLQELNIYKMENKKFIKF
ncbi:ABC transporter substrate-binding protein [Pelagibacteraceae bacterium]|nr:ABC transporter substrate-binding protein [Pelagibacteraceae bacterium]